MDREELLKIAKPILFNTEMVRAILDGRKTVTRRICKDGNDYTVPDMGYYNADKRTYAVHSYCDKRCTYEYQISTSERKCPICPGDILYVRETWKKAPNGYYYYEDWQKDDIADITKWKPSIHMPKKAARIFLKVTDVRVERLQNITEEQAKREGIKYDECPTGFTWKEETDMHNCYTTPIGAMQALWNSTIKKSDLDIYGWDADPWVWVIEFERIMPDCEV